MGRQESVAVFNRNLLIMSLLICAAVGASQASLLPFIDRPANGLFGELWADPFRILEEVPFGLERDESLVVPAARVDWKETPEGHMIAIDVPGLKKDELKIELEENRVLRVSGERKREEQKGDHWHRTERSYGQFWRQFRLPENVDLDTLNARLENGVLKLTMSKLAPDRIRGPRMVSIEEADHRDEAAKIKNVEAKQEL